MRFIDAFVDGLDLAVLGFMVNPIESVHLEVCLMATEPAPTLDRLAGRFQGRDTEPDRELLLAPRHLRGDTGPMPGGMPTVAVTGLVQVKMSQICVCEVMRL